LEGSKDSVAAVKLAETAHDAGEIMQEGQSRLLELYKELAASPVSQILDF